MVALELEELVEAVLAQGDALARVLPPCPGKILPIVSGRRMLEDCDALTGLG